MRTRTGLGRHARLDDAAGDPLEGLVNLFDLGIVLAIAFLAGGLTLTLTEHERASRHASTSATVETKTQALPPTAGAPTAHGQGTPVGTVYRLPDGRLVLVTRAGR